MSSRKGAASTVPLIGVSLASIILFVVVLSIPLAAGPEIGLSPALLATWIAGLYGIPSVLGILMAIRYRMPLAVTGTFVAIILVATVGDQFSYAELVGAFMLAGIVVVLMGVFGVTARLAQWVPVPIVQGLLAGAVLPFVVGIFAPLGDHTLMAGGALLTYVAARWLLGPRPIAILPALVVGIAVAGATGQLGQLPAAWSLPAPVLTWPAFSLQAIATITPVVVVLMTFQANVPSMVILHGQGYHPPRRTVDVVSGLGTVGASFLGPIAVSLSLPATSLISGHDAGDLDKRHRAIYVVNSVGLLIALLGGAAAVLSGLIPYVLLLALAGLAMLGVFIGAFQQMAKGPLVLGPVFAFAIAVSGVSLFGFGAFFWALVLGIGVSLLLERPAMQEQRTAAVKQG
ncbi:MAG: benzoate/H(+) symporter BenE family transporter [Dehalococcoidia bacterium]